MKIHRRKNTGQKAVKWLISCFVMLTLLVMQGEISGIGGGPTCPTCKKWDSYQGKCVNLCDCCCDCVNNNCIDKNFTDYLPYCRFCVGDDGEGGCEIWDLCEDYQYCDEGVCKCLSCYAIEIVPYSGSGECPACSDWLVGCEGEMHIQNSYEKWNAAVSGEGGWCKNPTKSDVNRKNCCRLDERFWRLVYGLVKKDENSKVT